MQQIPDRRIITYGFDKESDVQASKITATETGSCFDVIVRNRGQTNSGSIERLELPMYGEHNVLNSLVAIAISLEMGMHEDLIRVGLRDFKGVKRRFTKTGICNGIIVIDDYGHHPEEIKAALSATKLIAEKSKVLAIFQPHRYTRTKDNFNE